MAGPIRIGVKGLIIQDDKLLLVEYDDASGVHYNLPGGGIKPGESIKKALRREILEETSCEVKVGRLVLVGEYHPRKRKSAYGKTHKLTFYFLCKLRNGSQPSPPRKPDMNQIGVKWFPISDLPKSLLPKHHDLFLQALAEEKSRKVFTTRT